MSTIRIAVPPPQRADYDVVIETGILGRVAEMVTRVAPAYRYAVIADRSVAAHWAAPLLSSFREGGARVDLFEVEPGEEHKTRETWAALTDAMLEAGIGRDGAVIGLGGGVATDLAGFVAATFMRGLPLVQVPTSLLAMVDASVGGKTGVDTPAGKNLVGTFHQPRLVVIDPEVIRTLPEQELRNGLAEAVKHGAITDAGYLHWIEEEAEAILARDPDALALLIRRSIEIKARYVAEDPLEAGPRKALNFGHTVGHALEAIGAYRLPHGHAVAIGMIAESAAGEAAGVTEQGTTDVLREVLERLGLPVAAPEPADPAAIVALMRRDKKARGGAVHATLLERIGRVARRKDGGWTHVLDADLTARGLEAVKP